jgi:hypothetical protein
MKHALLRCLFATLLTGDAFCNIRPQHTTCSSICVDAAGGGHDTRLEGFDVGIHPVVHHADALRAWRGNIRHRGACMHDMKSVLVFHCFIHYLRSVAGLITSLRLAICARRLNFESCCHAPHAYAIDLSVDLLRFPYS